MNRGFFIILGAQFLSALADNALFIAALALLKVQHAPEWHQSMLLWCFTVSYVVLAPFAGSFADSMHKGRAMLLCNGIKLVGCLGMMVGVSPLLAYAIVGFGAAAYSPAKYGIITEYLPHDQLVAANGWLEGATVSAIIFGTVLGGFLVGPFLSTWLAAQAMILPVSAPVFAIAVLAVIYSLAGWVNAYIPKLNVELKPIHFNPLYLMGEFWDCVKKLWKDPQGQLSLGVTTLFWGAGATMRLVVLNWAIISLAFSLEQATRLVAIVAFGTAFGAVLAGKMVPLRQAFKVLPAGLMMGVLVMVMQFVDSMLVGGILMFLIGTMAGFFVVPLNAMLQHRGHLLMGAGHSIAVQNFNENLGILAMVGTHALLVKYFSQPIPATLNANAVAHFSKSGGIPPMEWIILGFGGFVALIMLMIMIEFKRKDKQGLMHD